MRYDPFPGPIGIFLENLLSSESRWEGGGGEGGINIAIIVTASTKKKADKGATFRHVCLV